MPQLVTLDKTANTDEIIAVIGRDGACIIDSLLAHDVVEQMMSEVMPYVDQTKIGADDFSGRQTQRTGALVARAPASRGIIMNELVLNAGRAYLAPFCARIILHLSQTIHILPQQGAQVLHRDRLAWGKYLPREIEPQFNTIWALTDFTEENGATQVVPGSHLWDSHRHANEDETCQAVMSKGSVLLYSGSVIHSGGANKAKVPRMGLNITYCLGWLRQEENQYLSCPPHLAKDLDPELQEILGYTMGDYALGYYSDPEMTEGKGAGILAPETILGRKPNLIHKLITDA